VQFRTDYSADRKGEMVVCALARSNLPLDVWILGSDSTRRITRLNPTLESIEYGKGREVQWKANDGLSIAGILLLPVGYTAGKRYPLITHMHGSNMGEANDFQVSSVHWGQMLAANGFAV
jgi:dipeptidyl aminopeptidase/acylaminoacyl peptidase